MKALSCGMSEDDKGEVFFLLVAESLLPVRAGWVKTELSRPREADLCVHKKRRCSEIRHLSSLLMMNDGEAEL